MDDTKFSVLTFPKQDKEVINKYIINFSNGDRKLILDEDISFQIVPGINFLMFFKDISDDQMQLIEAFNLDTIDSFRVLEEDEEIEI